MQLHPFVRMCQYFILTFVFQLIFFPFFLKEGDDNVQKFFTFDPEFGIFGWMSSTTNVLTVLCLVSPFTGICSNVGYLFAFQYFPMQIIAAAILTQPFVGQIAAVLMGLDHIPGVMTTLGLTSITFGIIVASYGIALKENEICKYILFHPIMISIVRRVLDQSTKN